MNIAIESICSLILFVLGLFAIQKYVKEENRKKQELIIYGVAEAVVIITMIILLNMRYDVSLLGGLKLIALISILLPVGFIDFKETIIPNAVVITGVVIRVILLAVSFVISTEAAKTELIDSAVAAGSITIFFLLIYVIFKNSIGAGDIKLYFMIGLYQGVSGSLSSLFFSLLVSFVVSVTLLITKKKKKNDVIPFGPCILLGTLISIGLTGM